MHRHTKWLENFNEIETSNFECIFTLSDEHKCGARYVNMKSSFDDFHSHLKLICMSDFWLVKFLEELLIKKIPCEGDWEL